MKSKNSIILMFLICVILALSGCVTATYDTKTKEVKYTRLFMTQNVGGVHVEMDDPNAGTVYIYIDNLKSDSATILKDAGALLMEGIKIGRGQI
jgi:hypothetical protein